MFDTDIKLYHIIDEHILHELLNSFVEKFKVTIGAYSSQFKREKLVSGLVAKENRDHESLLAGLEAPLEDLHVRSTLSNGKPLYFQSKSGHVETAYISIMYEESLVMVLGISLLNMEISDPGNGNGDKEFDLYPINSPAMELIEPVDNIKKELSLFVEAGCQRYKFTEQMHLQEEPEQEDIESFIIFTTPDNVILDSTPSFGRMLGSEPQSLIGLDVIDLLSSLADDTRGLDRALDDLSESETVLVDIPLSDQSCISRITLYPQTIGEIILGYEYHFQVSIMEGNTVAETEKEVPDSEPEPVKETTSKSAPELTPMLVSAQELKLFHSLPMPLVVVDEHSIIKIWNREIESVFNLPASSMIGRSLLDAMAEDSRSRWEQALTQIRESDQEMITPENELHMYDRDGKSIYMKTSLGKSKINEHLYYLLVILSTKSKQTSANSSETKSSPAGTMLNKSEKLELLQQVFVNFSQHMDILSGELYNHTSSILLSDSVDGDLHDHMASVKNIAKKLTLLKQNLHYFCNPVEPAFDTLDLNEKIRAWFDQMRDLTGPAIELQLNLNENIGRLRANSKQVKHSLKTLILNAVESYRDGGNIIVHTRRHDVEAVQQPVSGDNREKSFIVLEVIDAGRGIPVSIREKMFEPFNTNKPREIGRGLGLASVYGIMKNHKGFIAIKSLEEQGTVVSLYFPRSEVNESGHEREPDFISKQKILLIDDDSGIIEVNTITLKHFGFEVLSADSAKKGLELYRNHHHELSLIIQDISLPDMEGIDCSNALYEISDKVPLILSSGYQCTEVFYKFMQQTGAVFLQKPYTSNKLYQTIQSMLVRK